MSVSIGSLKSFLKAAITPIVGLLLVSCETTSQDTDQFIFLQESEPLFVEFSLSANPALEMNVPDIAERMRELRREDYMKVMQQLVYLYQLPVDVHLLGEREEPGYGPVLEINAIRFEQDRIGDLVATIHVKLHKYGELNTLGTYSERNVAPIAVNERQMEEAFQELIRSPLSKMLNDLMLHFETEEDREMVEAPLRELELE